MNLLIAEELATPAATIRAEAARIRYESTSTRLRQARCLALSESRGKPRTRGVEVIEQVEEKIFKVKSTCARINANDRHSCFWCMEARMYILFTRDLATDAILNRICGTFNLTK